MQINSYDQFLLLFRPIYKGCLGPFKVDKWWRSTYIFLIRWILWFKSFLKWPICFETRSFFYVERSEKVIWIVLPLSNNCHDKRLYRPYKVEYLYYFSFYLFMRKFLLIYFDCNYSISHWCFHNVVIYQVSISFNFYSLQIW